MTYDHKQRCANWRGANVSACVVHPPNGNIGIARVSEVVVVAVPLCLEVLEKLHVGGHATALLQVGGPQEGVQGVQLEAPLLVAAPLPARMHALAVQHVIRTEQEPMRQELEERLTLSMSSPHE